MIRKQRAPLGVLALERRDCPALTVAFAAGNLTVSGSPPTATAPTDTLAIRRVSPGAFAVEDTTGGVTRSFGTYRVTGDIRLQLTGSTKPINLTLGGDTVPGNVSIDLGLGAPASSGLAQTLNVTGGRIAGSLTVRNGSGAERINLGDPAGAVADALTVGSDAILSLRNGSIGDIVSVSDASIIGRDLLATSVEGLTVGFDITPGGGRVNRNLTVSDAASTTPAQVTVNGSVGGSLTVTGTPSPSDLGDLLSLGGNSVVGGLSANLGNGVNTFQLSGVVLGSASLVGGSGSNAAFPANAATLGGSVGGSLAVTFGNAGGIGNQFQFLQGASVAGSLAITTGSGANDLSVFQGTVGGSLAITLGNGSNTFTFDGVNGAAVNGGRLTYRGGSGIDSVTVTGANSFALDVALGVGADIFAYGEGASVGRATIDFGADIDTYDDGGNAVTWPQTLVNLP